MKLWITLLRAIGTHKVGALIEVDEPIGRAYIAAGAAEEHKTAAADLASGVAAGDDPEGLAANLRALVTTEVKTAIAEATRGLAEAGRPNVQLVVTEAEDDKKLRTGGFRNVGHFAHAMVRGMNPEGAEPASATLIRDWQGLVSRAVTGMSAGDDASAGLLIPPEFTTAIWDKTRDYENLANRIGLTPTSGNGLSMPGVAESSRANGSRFGGVQGYWAGEAAQYTGSKPTFYMVELKLHKLTVLVYATDELIEDAPALEGFINRVAPQEIAFKVNDAVTNGSGAGIPLGYLNAPCKVTTTAVASQGAATIVGQNITDIWARVYAPSRRNGVWIMNQDAETQLDGLKFATGSSSGQLVYMPPSGLSGAPYSTIKGRPVLISEQAATLGTEGDISFVDFSQYVGITKASGVKADSSIHLRFDYGETVFRFSFRMDAQPMWKAALTPFKGTATQSPIVTLSSTRT